jgi:hypothetical protein
MMSGIRLIAIRVGLAALTLVAVWGLWRFTAERWSLLVDRVYTARMLVIRHRVNQYSNSWKNGLICSRAYGIRSLSTTSFSAGRPPRIGIAKNSLMNVRRQPSPRAVLGLRGLRPVSSGHHLRRVTPHPARGRGSQVRSRLAGGGRKIRTLGPRYDGRG